MLPKLTKFDVFDDMFNEPFFTKRDNQIMKTDIRETGKDYILDIDLPGYEKNNIQLELEDGYLTISAKTEKEEDNSDEKKNYIHKERFYGECSRNFYIGDNVKEEDITASFKNGILTITFTKENVEKENNKKYIEISE